MEIKEAIETLSDSADRGITTHNQDFRDALHMGIQALILFRSANITIDPKLTRAPQLRLSAYHLRQHAILFNTKSYPYPVPADSPDEAESKSRQDPRNLPDLIT